jgi:hypothetical protein
MNVELIYDSSCPNVEATRVALRRAFAKLGNPPRWTEWERSAPDSPAYAGNYGSPTILVDGQDIVQDKPSGESCRVYAGSLGMHGGVPPLDKIVEALNRAPGGSGSSGLFAAVPTTGVFLLPIGTCPACWPAYAAFLSSLGLGFLLSERYLLPVAGIFLVATLAAFTYRASARRGYGPFLVGVASATIAVVGKFFLASAPILSLGLVGLFAAAVWNAWPRRQVAPCHRYTSDELDPQQEVSE